MQYCSDCGRPLRDGEVCACTAAYGQEAPGQTVYQDQQPHYPDQAGGYQPNPYAQPAYQQPYTPRQSGSLGAFFKSFFRTPARSTADIARAGASGWLLLGGVYALVCAVFLPLLMSQTLNALFRRAIRLMDVRRVAAATGALQTVSMPSFQFGLTAFFCAALLLFLTALVWMLLTRGPGGPMPFKACFAGVCASTYPSSLLLAAACIFGFVSAGLAAALLVCSVVVFLANSAATLEEMSGSRPNWLYGVLMTAALLVCLLVCFQLLNGQIMDTYYQGRTLRDKHYANKLTDLLSASGLYEYLYGIF